MAVQLQSFLRIKQVKLVTGLSRSSIYEAIRQGTFPAPIQIGTRAVAWPEELIAQWQDRCIKQSNKTTI